MKRRTRRFICTLALAAAALLPAAATSLLASPQDTTWGADPVSIIVDDTTWNLPADASGSVTVNKPADTTW